MFPRLLLFLLATVLFFLAYRRGVEARNSSPIIAILTIPSDGKAEGPGQGYIAASYVKWIEGAGGRVIPLDFDASEEDLLWLLNRVQGVLLTGGAADDLDEEHQYYRTVERIVDYCVDTHTAGDYFPIFGTCLGFEAITQALSKDKALKTVVDASNVALVTDLTDYADVSVMFDDGRYGSALARQLLITEEVTFHAHGYGYTAADYANDVGLSRSLHVLGTSFDRNGVEFASIIEGVGGLPVFGVQFHPEKPLFEWTIDIGLMHNPHARHISQYLANFFVDMASKATGDGRSLGDWYTEHEYLIYRYYPTELAEKPSSIFQQKYLFNVPAVPPTTEPGDVAAS